MTARTAMSLDTLRRRVDDLTRHDRARAAVLDVVVVVQGQGGLDGATCVPVAACAEGKEEDAGKFMLYPEVPLTCLTADDLAAIRESGQIYALACKATRRDAEERQQSPIVHSIALARGGRISSNTSQQEA